MEKLQQYIEMYPKEDTCDRAIREYMKAKGITSFKVKSHDVLSNEDIEVTLTL